VKAPNLIQLKDSTQFLHEYLGHELPYLFKILSVNTALSIQAHPDKKLAEQLHKERPHIYKDPNHKPELCLALTPFEAMCKFRLLPKIRAYLASVPELVQVVGERVSQQFIGSASSSAAAQKDALRILFKAIVMADKKVVETQAHALVARFQSEISAEPESVDSGRLIDIRKLVVRLGGQYPGDVGIFMPFFLNCLRLQPGEALFLSANEPHAYLSGDCIEAMACSDNVVRAGLTPKLIDKDTLCAMLTYEDVSVPLLPAQAIDEHTRLYAPNVPEFAVSHTVLPAQTSYRLAEVAGDAILLVISGSAQVTPEASEHKQTPESTASRSLSMGSVIVVLPGVPLNVQSGAEGVTFSRCLCSPATAL